MKNVGKIFIPLTLFGLFGCASVPPPSPLAPEMAAVGISVKIRAPIGLFSGSPDRVYFVKVEREDDLYSLGQFILSNYVQGSQVYLLNARPGRYAAVASSATSVSGPYGQKRQYRTFFPKQLIKLTEVTVTPGTIMFMGEYVLDSSTSFAEADDAQRHYLHLIAPGARAGLGGAIQTGMFSAIFPAADVDFYYKASLKEEKRDPEAEQRFLNAALNHLKGSDWVGMVQKRLQELKAR